MPVVRPFPGLLYADTRPEAMARVLAPPFDMIRPEDQDRLFAESDHNIARLTVARWGQDPAYREAAARLADWRRAGVFARDPEPAFYVYEQAGGSAGPLPRPGAAPPRLRGLLAAVRLEEAQGPGIYPHESTFPRPVEDRLQLIQATRCHLEPVFGIYADEGGVVDPLLAEVTAGPPIWTTVLPDGSRHCLWRMTDPGRLRTIQQALADRRVVIADGHHRFAGAKAYRDLRREQDGLSPDAPWEYTLMLLSDTETGGLTVGPFHRVVIRLPEATAGRELADLLGEGFAVERYKGAEASEEAYLQALLGLLKQVGRSGPVFACLRGAEAAIVRPADVDALLAAVTPPVDPTMRLFDVALLHRFILEERLGCVGDYSPQALNVLFEHDPLAAWRAVRSGAAAMAWLVNPADIHAVMRVAFHGHTVPQKATYFYPKPPSGMVIYEV